MIAISLWTLFVMHLKALKGTLQTLRMDLVAHERSFTYNIGEMTSENRSGKHDYRKYHTFNNHSMLVHNVSGTIVLLLCKTPAVVSERFQIVSCQVLGSKLGL